MGTEEREDGELDQSNERDNGATRIDRRVEKTGYGRNKGRMGKAFK